MRASCKDAAAIDLSAYYNTATKVLGNKQIKTVFNQEKAVYLQSLASSMRIPAQIAPLAGTVSEVSLSPDDLRQVVGAFVSSLSAIAASDREMAAAEETGHLTHAIESLSAKLAQANISATPLLAAYRGFLVRSLTREHCADHSLDRAEMARAFNALASATTPEPSDVPPLSSTELYAKSTGDAASDDTIPFNQQLLPQLQRITAAYQARVAEQSRLGKPGTIEPEYSDVEDVLEYSVSLERGGAACRVCDFYSKGSLFMVLVAILPAGQQLQRAIDSEVDYLSSNAMQNEDPTAWLLLLQQLINMSRKPTDGGTAVLTAEVKKGNVPWGIPSPEAAVIRSSLRRSSDPIIAAYVSADDLLHLPYVPFPPRGK